jgi:hypothetical protein
MATQHDVRQIALALPGVRESEERFAFSVENKGKEKGFAWVWLERLEAGKARVPNPGVLAVRVRDQAEKAALLAGDPRRFFTEPHYNGFPAVLVRLRAIGKAQLAKLIVDGWRCQAPRQIQEQLKDAPARPLAPRRRVAAARAARSRRA